MSRAAATPALSRSPLGSNTLAAAKMDRLRDPGCQQTADVLHTLDTNG
jgi:hypothetical protein